ncbi:helix-turn-helix domain-containing protein [Nonomuraea sp. NPDC000554]|uniref:PucR family transcriptional regulator n=1 Tax=Nonomuraea sp. NPDC000554 TaxID=3154259 RepID=UPI0033251B45
MEYLEPTLAEVIEHIGERLVSVVIAPRGLGVPVAGPSIHDPLRDGTPPPGSVVLLVGLTAGSPGVEEALRGLKGAAAAILRDEPGALQPLAPAAAAAGVALLALPGAMTWSHVHTVVEEALLGGLTFAESGPDLGGTPAGDLNAFVNAVAETLDRPVGIVDTQWRLLAYSAVPGQTNDALQRDVILSRAVPVTNAPRETRYLLLTGERALRFMTGPPYDEVGHEIWRIGAGIRAGPEPLGMLWVLEGREQLPADRIVLIEEFARLAGAHVLHLRTTRRADRERHGALVSQALEGRDPRAACHRLGLAVDSGLAVVAVADLDAATLHPTDAPPPAAGTHASGRPSATTAEPHRGEQLLDRVATYLDAFRRSAACLLRDGVVYCLMPAAGAREFAVDLTRQLGPRRRLAAAVGGRATPDELPRSLHHANLVLSVLRSSGTAPLPGITVTRGGVVAGIDDVRAAATLAELRAVLEDHPGLLLHEGDPLPDSVPAWIECNGDVRAAAERLGVHPNTIRYRIRRLAARGLDLNDPDTRLTVWLRSRLRRDGE